MRHQCKVTVIDKKCYPDLQQKYLANPQSGPCPCFAVGDEFVFDAKSEDFWHFGQNLEKPFPCAECWDAISRYVWAALQGGSIMRGWTLNENEMIACCNDGTRPVIFKIERIDIEE